MDLTNIKPCVKCEYYGDCRDSGLTCGTELLFERLKCIFVYGGDCFEEGDNG